MTAHLTTFTEQDQKYMQLALQEAEKGLYTTAPNPRVGCVLVKDNLIIGKGYHRAYGEAHAETLALKHSQVSAEKATAYVTLEPCAHTGKNPPCAEALIVAGVSTVFVATKDPNPLVAGQGIEKLQAANIQVHLGLLEQQAIELNRGFLHRMQHGKPWVRVKMAQSLDGRTAMQSGESQWITGPQARQDVQRWRARSQAIVTGIETVIQDDCRLTVRTSELDTDLPHNFDQNQPLRVVLDSGLRMPLNALILNNPDRVVIVTCCADVSRHSDFLSLGVKVLVLPEKDNKICLLSLIDWLAEQNINEVLVEAGATLCGAFVAQHLVNELLIYIAPVIMGSKGRPLFKFDIEDMCNRLHIKEAEIQAFGNDWRFSGLLNAVENQSV